MSDHASLDDDDELLAAELAFGLLDPAERAAALARAERDDAFAAALDRWQAQVVSLAETGATIAAPAALWERISARLPANDAAARTSPSLRRWQVATGLAAAAALVLAVLLVGRRPLPPPVPPPSPTMVAVLSDPVSRSVLVVDVMADRRRIVAAPAHLDVGRHSPELWVIPPGGKPISLGVLDPGRASSLPLHGRAAEALQVGATLAVSSEPVGGSPTGQPTGPVILTGTVQRT